MVEAPDDYPWSSFGSNVLGQKNDFITPHGQYEALGADKKARFEGYRALFDIVLDADCMARIRASLADGNAIGE